MGKLILFLVVLMLFGLAGLTGYAYLGPSLGADFSPETREIRETLTLTPKGDG